MTGAFTQAEAAAYLGVEESYLDEPPIPWVDIRKPGRRRAVRRFRKIDLDRFLEERLVLPGQNSLME